jgi:protein CpxP
MKKRMEKILNPKQFEKWTALKEEHQGNRKENRRENRQGRHPEKQQRRG